MAERDKRPASLTSYLVRRCGRCKGGERLEAARLSIEQCIGRGAVLRGRFPVSTDPGNFGLQRGDARRQLVLAERVEILTRKLRQRILWA